MLAACKVTTQPSHEASDDRNVAADTVRYVESGATCEAVFTEPLVHVARCTMPNGAKLYCTADARGGSANPTWACVTLNTPNPQQGSGKP